MTHRFLSVNKLNTIFKGVYILSKEDKIELEGEVCELLPNALFKVNVGNDKTVLATLSGRMRTNNINVLLYDKVVVEVSTYDISRGRIVFRRK